MYKQYFKRFFDFTISLIGFIIISPIFIIITILLIFTNQGKPFFTQSRPGKNEKIFQVVKFKTMNDKRDEKGKLLSDKDRLTKVGSFIRKISLDEIPQILNVIKGDMSLVGPRPLLIEYLPYYTEEEKLRHTVRPGITGWAQVNGRNNLDWDSRLKLDGWYAQNISFSLDIKILFKTAINVVQRKDVVVLPDQLFARLDEHRKSL